MDPGRKEAAMLSCCFDPPRCETKDVVVRFVRSACYADPALAAHAAELLGSEERQLLARLEPEAARLDYLAAHALVRSVVAELADCDASEIEFKSGHHERPRAFSPQAAQSFGFSLSHADGIALCAVASECGVGADVESERNVGRYARGLAEGLCSSVERDELISMSPALRTERILSLWTLNEAMAKAIGSRNGETQRAVQPHVASVRLLPHHLATIAVVGAPAGDFVSVQFEEYLPQ
jgi:4'-phosphopantetheinyl transferase